MNKMLHAKCYAPGQQFGMVYGNRFSQKPSKTTMINIMMFSNTLPGTRF